MHNTIPTIQKDFFRAELPVWAQQVQRNLPWKINPNAYTTWLSEIILQQTRLEQGLPYYQRFVQAYPTLTHLANATDNDVLKMWEGLGYYARARNMLATARYIQTHYNGQFPTTYPEIRALKGIGDYTAAAIASFAYGLPHAVVDGNVYRVLARFFGIHLPTHSTQGKQQFNQLAHELLDTQQCGAWNQAMMDFGATHCKPLRPLCSTCPLQPHCTAYHTHTIATLPLKTPKPPKKNRYFYYLIPLPHESYFWVHTRPKGDIWAGLHQFPLYETDQPLTPTQLTHQLAQQWHTLVTSHQPSHTYTQTLTHQVIHAIFVPVQFRSTHIPGYQQISKSQQQQVALPKVIRQFWENTQQTLF
jgi:A/G-specific adenine glycosylase